MAFKVGDKFLVNNTEGQVIKADTSVSPGLYTLLFEQPAVKVLTETQLTSQAVQLQPAVAQPAS